MIPSVPDLTPLANEIMERLPEVYGAARDPDRAGPMAAYMRHQFPFLGISSTSQQALARRGLAGLPRPAEADLAAVARACWELPEREYQYFACRLLRRYARVCGPGFMTVARDLIVTKSWWDTVDALAPHLVGPLVRRHPELLSELDAWIEDANVWLVRAALLHQLTARTATDERRLFDYCARQAGHPDFFVRKAIGWALRAYAKSEPDRVRDFVTANRSRLAPLSIREALKHLA